MSIWTKNILEFKLVRVLIILGTIAFAIFYLINSNSLESKCKRKIDKSSSYLPVQPSNKLQKLQLDMLKKQLIKECVEKEEVQ